MQHNVIGGLQGTPRDDRIYVTYSSNSSSTVLVPGGIPQACIRILQNIISMHLECFLLTVALAVTLRHHKCAIPFNIDHSGVMSTQLFRKEEEKRAGGYPKQLLTSECEEWNAENGAASTVEKVLSVPSQPGDPVFYSNSSSITPAQYKVSSSSSERGKALAEIRDTMS